MHTQLNVVLLPAPKRAAFHIKSFLITGSEQLGWAKSLVCTLPEHRMGDFGGFKNVPCYVYFVSNNPINYGDSYIYNEEVHPWRQEHSVENISEFKRIEYSSDPKLQNAPKIPLEILLMINKEIPIELLEGMEINVCRM